MNANHPSPPAGGPLPPQERTRERADILALMYQRRVTIGHDASGDWRVFFRTHDRVLHDVTAEAEAIWDATHYARGNGR